MSDLVSRHGGQHTLTVREKPDHALRLTGLMYFPLQNVCMEATATTAEPTIEDVHAIDTHNEIAQGTNNVGTIEAISVETGRTVWKFEHRAGQTSVIATGGGLLFGGDTQGRFRAFDQRTGEILWEANLGSQVTGFPATFAVDGKQYIAVSTGSALNTMSLAALARELRAGTDNDLYVFVLP